jgi:LuxR family maltose regulon positive regulatory protein
MLRLAVAQVRGDLPAAVKEAQPLLAPVGDPDAARPGPGEDLRALALVRLGVAELSAVQPDEAERHLEQGAALARRIGRPWLEVSATAHSAWAAVFRSQTLGAQMTG